MNLSKYRKNTKISRTCGNCVVEYIQNNMIGLKSWTVHFFILLFIDLFLNNIYTGYLKLQWDITAINFCPVTGAGESWLKQ